MRQLPTRLKSLLLLLAAVYSLGLAGCVDQEKQKSFAQPQKELIFYDWADDVPMDIFRQFEKQTGYQVVYKTFESSEEAAANIQKGFKYDVVSMDHRLIPGLIHQGLLSAVNHSNIPNFKNISFNFRNLSYDPENRYSIPFNWGTTGLIVRTDLIKDSVTRWEDLWNPNYAGKVGLWETTPRENLSLTLKALGYSANSENPEELDQAVQKLCSLKPDLVFIEALTDAEVVSEPIIQGELGIALSYAGDVIKARESNSNVEYVLPADGALLWGESFVIPANTQNKEAAEALINFLMEPKINAEITNFNVYATPNQSALEYIDPEILNDPVIFPPNEYLANAELLLALSPEGEQLYQQAWENFLACPPKY